MRRRLPLLGVLALCLLAPVRSSWCASPARAYPQEPVGSAFVEEFGANQLGATVFHPARAGRYWDSWLDGTLVTVVNSVLVVSGRVPNVAKGLPRVGGVTSAAYYAPGRFTFRARARLAKGLVAALHLYNEDRDRQSGGRREEIDLELSSDTPGVVSWDTYHDDDWTNDTRQNAMHRGDFSRAQRTPGLGGFDSRQFHTYTVEWRPDRVAWFIDGAQIATATEAIPTARLQIRLDIYHNHRWDEWLGITSSGVGTLEVDRVRYEADGDAHRESRFAPVVFPRPRSSTSGASRQSSATSRR